MALREHPASVLGKRLDSLRAGLVALDALSEGDALEHDHHLAVATVYRRIARPLYDDTCYHMYRFRSYVALLGWCACSILRVLVALIPRRLDDLERVRVALGIPDVFHMRDRKCSGMKALTLLLRRLVGSMRYWDLEREMERCVPHFSSRRRAFFS